MIYAKTTFFDSYLEIYLSNKKISNKKKMHLDAKSNHVFFISYFYAFRLFIDYRESTVQLKCRVPLFDPGIELRSIPFPSDGFVRFQHLIINNISVFEGFWPSFTRTVVKIEITVFEATEPIMTRCFT